MNTLPRIGVVVTGLVLVVCAVLPAYSIPTGDGWSRVPTDVPAFLGPYAVGGLIALAGLFHIAGDSRTTRVVVALLLGFVLMTTLWTFFLQHLLLVDTLDHGGRSPDVRDATTVRVGLALAVAWFGVIYMLLGIDSKKFNAESRTARFAVGSAIVTATWFGIMTAASDAYYGILISLAATFGMVAFGHAWELNARS